MEYIGEIPSHRNAQVASGIFEAVTEHQYSFYDMNWIDWRSGKPKTDLLKSGTVILFEGNLGNLLFLQKAAAAFVTAGLIDPGSPKKN